MKVYGLEDLFYFGKYKGKTVREVIDSGPEGKGYIRWAATKPILEIDDEVKTYLKSGKVKDKPQEKLPPKELDFWQKIILKIDIPDNCPF